MAYYDALINAWSTTPNPPAGVTGVGITSTQTTAAKLANINGWTITGVIPASLLATGAQLANCTVWTDFTALSTGQQLAWLTLCSAGSGMLGGSTNVGLLLDGMAIAFFSSVSQTRANFTALAQGAVTPWWQANGYASPIGGGDLIAAGGLS